MENKVLKILLMLILIAPLSYAAGEIVYTSGEVNYVVTNDSGPVNDNCVTVFWGRGCPHCAQAKLFLEDLQNELNFTMVTYEVYYSDINQEVFANTSFYYESLPMGVPAIVAGDRLFVGYQESNDSIFHKGYNAWIGTSGEIERAVREGGNCPPTVQVDNVTYTGDPKIIQRDGLENDLIFPDKSPGLFESIEQNIMKYYQENSTSPTEKHSVGYLVFSAMILGAGDGILNPCTISIIIFLVVYLFSIKAKDRIVSCGLAFITAVGLVYGLFLVALLFFMQKFFLGWAGTARIVLALIAGTFGILEFREAWLVGKKKGKKLLKVPDRAMKKIQKLLKMATPASSFVVGLFAAFAEIPCAGSFPLVFTSIISGLPKATWIPLVLLYVLFFTIPLAVLVMAFRMGLNIKRVEKLYQGHKKEMRIFAGIILLGFAWWFVMGG